MAPAQKVQYARLEREDVFRCLNKAVADNAVRREELKEALSEMMRWRLGRGTSGR